MQYVVVNHAEQRKKRKKIIKKILCFLVLVAVLAVGIALWVYWRSMTPTILDIANVLVQSEATRAVNEAVLCVFGEGVDCNRLLTIERNSQNDVVLLSANSSAVNSLARRTSLVAQDKIEGTFQDAIEIPLGTLSGIPLLSGLGPNVNISVAPIGSVCCNIVSVFESAGINQTLHRIYLYVESKVDLIVPTSHQVVELSTPVLLCETLIVGKVPETFLQGGLLLGSG